MEVLKEKVQFQKYPAYKNSGIEWVGEAPSHWSVKKLKHIFFEKKKTTNPELNCGSISFGKVVYKDDEKVTEATKSSYQEVLEGDFLINPLNLNYDLISLRIALSEIDVVVSSGYIVLKNRIDLNKKYFNYLLHIFDVSYMKTLGSGVRQTLSFTHIANSELLLPPKQEQTVIAGFLDEKCGKIDTAIEQKQKLIELLKERKQILIQNAVTKGLDPDVKMKDSGVEWIGEIPEHWDCIRIKHLSKKITDGEHISPEFTNDGMPFLSAKDIRDGYIKFPNNKFVSYRDGKKFRQRCNPEKGDLLLVSRGATIGRISQVDTDKEFCLLGSVILIKTNHKIANDFIVVAMANDKLKEEFLNTSHHSAQQAIYIVKAAEVYIPAPPLLEQNEIVSYLEIERKKIDNAIQLHQQQIEKLKEYKSSLIDAAVTGKIKVN